MVAAGTFSTTSGIKAKPFGSVEGAWGAEMHRVKRLAGSEQFMGERVYLDWNATAPLRPAARAAMVAALDACGNPSSVHSEGRAARRLIEEAREQVAALVGAKARNVVFTSGGTEANMMALSPATGAGR